MDKFKRWIWVGLAVALVAAVGAFFWLRQGDEAEAVPPRTILPGHSSDVLSLAFFPDGKTLISADANNAIHVWDVATGKGLYRASAVYAAVSPNGQLIAVVASLSEYYLWNFSTGETRKLEANPASSHRILLFSPNGQTVAAPASNPGASVSIWDVETGALIQTFEGEWLMYSPDSKRLVTTGNAARVWDIDTGALVHTLGGTSDKFAYTYAAYSPDGKRILTARYGIGIHIWDAETGGLIKTFQGDHREAETPAYYPDGKTISSVSDAHVRIWDAETGDLIKKLYADTDDYSWHYLSLDGKTLVRSGPNALTIWDAGRGKRLHTLSHSSDQIFPMTQSPDGKTIAGANKTGEIYIWRVE